MKVLYNGAFQFFLAFLVLEGAIKYLLGSLGLSYLIYFPKVLLITCVLLKFYVGLTEGRASKVNFSLFVIIIWSLFAGFYFIGNVGQVLFGAYSFLPFIFGYLMADKVDITEGMTRFIELLFITAFVGLILDFYFDLPWEGFSYETFGRENEGSRNWNQFELTRPAGFSVISWAVASHLAVFGIIAIGQTENLIKKIMYSFLLLIGVLISTTKGVIMALVALSFFLIIPKRWRFLAFSVTLLFSWVLPISVLFFDYKLPELDSVYGLLTYSFFMRMTDAWPRYFEILGNFLVVFVGKGFGAFGQASYRVLTPESHAVDSLFLYVIGILGLPGTVFFYHRLIKKVRVFIKANKLNFVAVIYAFIVYGIIVSGLEFGVWGLILGYLLGSNNVKLLKGKNESIN